MNPLISMYPYLCTYLFPQEVVSTLEPGLRDVLNDMVTKALRKVVSQPAAVEDIDDTILV